MSDKNELREKVNKEIKTVIVPELRKLNFKGSFPHFKRIFDDGKVDYLSFQFNKYGGSFIIELAVAYPFEGKKGNFYYWDKVTPEVVKKSKKKICNYLFSLTLSSALKSLTSVFGMGTGVSSLLSLLI